MKTFKWTVPEFTPSGAEENQRRQSEEIDDKQPTKRELKEFERWEKVRRKGLKSFAIRSALSITVIILAIVLLHFYSVITISSATMPAILGGPIGSMIGIFISWKRYNKQRPHIEAFLRR